MRKTIVAASGAILCAAASAADSRVTFNLNHNWQFFRPPQGSTDARDSVPTNAQWEKVSLPHSVRLEPLNASGGRNYQGVCWYRKTFAADKAWAGNVVLLRFEGAMQVADIWLNEKKLTTHYGGYQPFTIDLTGQLSPGATNTLVVRLDNSYNPEVPPGKPQRDLDFTYFGGLYRDVTLVVMNTLHITDEILANKVAGGGVFVRYPEVSRKKAMVEVLTDVANESGTARSCLVRQSVIAEGGTVVASSTQEMRIAASASAVARQMLAVAQPALWHPCHPNLYTLKTEVCEGGTVLDEKTTRIGIRRIAFTPEGLFINGEKHVALGFNRHQDHPYVGYALPHSAHYRDALKMREAGYTSFRSHYPQDPAFMEACDELGIVCIVSNPGWQFFGNQTWVDRVNQNAREMVRRDRNHASVVVWEPFPNETQYSEAFARLLHDIVHEEYPGDQCFTAGDGEIGNANKFVDIIWSRETVAGKPFWGREWGDSVDNWGDQQGRVRVARGWGEAPLIVQALNHVVKLNDLYKNSGGGPSETRMGGAGLWAGIDCYRGYHYQPFYGGPLDLFRLPKFDYYFFQSQRPTNVKINGVDGGPMVFIATYASAYSAPTVTVFSNCEEVRFHANDRIVVTQKPDKGYLLGHPPFTFVAKTPDAEKPAYYMTNTEPDYHYEPTRYKAEGLIGGKVVAVHEVMAPGVMRQIRLEVDRAGRDLVADGADWIRVYAKICDDKGTVHPFADALVEFTVVGEGTIIGGADIGANPVHAEAGIATVLVRSTEKAGTITVKASSFGLAAGTATIESKAGKGRTL